MRRLALALLAAASLAPHVSAQPASAPPRFDPPISNELVAGLSGAVLDGMPNLRCGAGPCAAATAAERAGSLLTTAEAREIIRKGMLSQIGACAGVDWERAGFAPMMADYRHRQKKSDRQLAFIGALHGAGMGLVLNSLGGVCPKN